MATLSAEEHIISPSKNSKYVDQIDDVKNMPREQLLDLVFKQHKIIEYQSKQAIELVDLLHLSKVSEKVSDPKVSDPDAIHGDGVVYSGVVCDRPYTTKIYYVLLFVVAVFIMCLIIYSYKTVYKTAPTPTVLVAPVAKN